MSDIVKDILRVVSSSLQIPTIIILIILIIVTIIMIGSIIAEYSAYPAHTREALARQLIADEENRYAKITRITDLIARVAPMFGLMGTLIPLGPGLIALAQGDTKTLSDSLLIAFDTTVAGLISAAISFVISGIRKGWYEQYMTGLETIMETILEEQDK